MELNSLLFPAPTIKYSAEELDGEALYIPRFFKYSSAYRHHVRKQKQELKNWQKITNAEFEALKVEEKKSLNDLNNIMNNIGKKKSIKDVDMKYNTERCEETKDIHDTINVNDTSKMDLSEIQEENPIAEPVNNF